MTCIEIVANVASILTALAAIYFFADRWFSAKKRARRLLDYLQMLKKKHPQEPARSIVHLMARLGMTQADVLQAALFYDSMIFRSIRPGGKDDPIARDIMFVYDPDKAKGQENLA